MDTGDYGGCFPSSPLHVRRSSAQLFLDVPESSVGKPARGGAAIQETPMKARSEEVTKHSYPSSEKENTREGDETRIQDRPVHGGQDSIYKTLGWDDVDDDLDDLT